MQCPRHLPVWRNQREFAHTNPRMNEPGMMEKERHQTEPGGVAESKKRRHGPSKVTRACFPRTERSVQRRRSSVPDRGRRRETGHENSPRAGDRVDSRRRTACHLSVSVERRAAHDVAAVGNGVRIRGVAGGEIIDQAVEESNAPVAAGEDQEPRIESAVFLLGHLCLRNVEEFVVGCAFDERSTDLPAFSRSPGRCGRPRAVSG